MRHDERQKIAVLFAVSALIISPACSKKEEKVESVRKVKKYSQEYSVITQEKLDQWLLASERVSAFIGKYALKDESIRNKNEFMMIAHSSPRIEAELRTLFDGTGLKSGEFWWILERLNEAKVYSELKIYENEQNRTLDILLVAGKTERADLEKDLAAEKDDEMRSELKRRLGIVNAKFSELSGLKGDMNAVNLRLEPENIAVWEKNRDRIEAAVKKIWKIAPVEKEEIPRDKSIPGH